MNVLLDQLRNLPEVPFTTTWRPYGHYDILEKLNAITISEGLKRTSTRYELNNNTHNMYGLITFQTPNPEYQRLLAIRNSTDKSFSLGLCSGCHVMVCSNGCFNGDFNLIHIHDRSLTDERIYDMLLQATRAMIIRSAQTMEWLESLKEIAWTISKFKASAFDLMAARIIPPVHMGRFVYDIVVTNTEVDKPFTPYVLQNAVTRFYRERPIAIQQRLITKANSAIKLMI